MTIVGVALVTPPKNAITIKNTKVNTQGRPSTAFQVMLPTAMMRESP